jgi:hypothetical protein
MPFGLMREVIGRQRTEFFRSLLEPARAVGELSALESIAHSAEYGPLGVLQSAESFSAARGDRLASESRCS